MKNINRILGCILSIAFFCVTITPVAAHPALVPAPTLTSVSPSQGWNHQPTTITITGSNLVATPTAVLNHAPLAVTFVNATTLTAIVPADLPTGQFTLTITNPDTQSASLVNAFTVLPSSDGNLGPWQFVNSMTTPRGGLAAVAVKGNLYAIGGMGPLASVERAPINADGTLGAWQATTPMSSGRWILAAVAWGDYVYVLGGHDGSVALTSVERAAINPDGTLGAWQAMNSMNTARAGHAAVVVGQWVYALGGSVETVERAAINPDGTLGTWQMTTSLSTSRWLFPAVTNGGYIYALGGYDLSINALSSVERATVNADGTLGTWQTVNSLTTVRAHHAGVSARGYIYALGGFAPSQMNSIERTTINADGSLGTWQVIGAMNTPRSDFVAVMTGGSIYAVGSYIGTPSWGISSVEKASLNTTLGFLPTIMR